MSSVTKEAVASSQYPDGPARCVGYHYPQNPFSSVAQLCPTLREPMNHSTPGLPVHHQLPEFIQTHVHRVGVLNLLKCGEKNQVCFTKLDHKNELG